MGFYVFLGIIAVLTAFVILSFLGPEKSEKPFWIAVQRIRAVLDRISYGIICAVAVGCLALVAVSIVRSLTGG